MRDREREAQLEDLISNLPAAPKGVSLPSGWQDSVLAQVDAAEDEAALPSAPSVGAPVAPAIGASRSPAVAHRAARPRRIIAAAAVLAAAAAVMIAFAVDRTRGDRDPPGASPRLAFEIRPGDRPSRSPAAPGDSDASIGDTLLVEGVADGAGELRIYNTAGTEIARCAQPTPDCTIELSGARTVLRFTLALRSPGAIHAALFSAQLGTPSTGLDGDVEAAGRAGIAVIRRELTVH